MGVIIAKNVTITCLYRFHDCTVISLGRDVSDSVNILNGIKPGIVSDRKCLRKLFINSCIALPTNSYYCKKDNYDIVVENINGSIYLAGKDRYDVAPGGYGGGTI